MSVIGKDIPRTDAWPKLTGRAIYTVDYTETGTLYGCILRATIPAARIKRIDATKAEKLPGVRAIVTAANFPPTLGGWLLRDRPLFARDVIRHEGEPLAAVAADTERQARAALAHIDVELDELPPLRTPEEALRPDARFVHPQWDSYDFVAGLDYVRSGNISCELVFDPGGVDEAFAFAHTIVEDEFSSDRQYQAYVEPKSAVAVARGQRLTIHTGHQMPFNVRDRLAQFFDMRLSDIRVVGHTIGGAFGAKLDIGAEPYAAALALAVPGRPVKIVFTRDEDMLVCPVRDSGVVRIRTALDPDGHPLAREVNCTIDNGAYSGEIPMFPSLVMHTAGGCYKADKTRIVARSVYTNTTPTGAMRGVTGVYVYAAMEQHMDHIARTTHKDRRQVRLDSLLSSGDTLLNGQVMEDAGILREAFDAIESKAPWVSVTESRKPLTGVGIGAATWLTNGGGGSISMRLTEDGTVSVVTAANDNGSGALTMAITQIVAEELGLRPEDVHIFDPDTDAAGFDAGSAGGRTTHVVGKAATFAAAEVRQKIFDLAAGVLEPAEQELELKDGKVRVKDAPDSAMSLAQVATMATYTTGPILGTGSYATAPVPFHLGCATSMVTPVLATPTYHVHFAEVEINPVTGGVAVRRYIVAQEVGRALNPMGIKGQIQGAVTQGIGHTLYEGLRVRNARYMERSLKAYRLPLTVDIPEVEVILLEHPDKFGPFGAKGVGEAAILLPGAVINSAVADALGGEMLNRIPITPEDVLERLVARQI